MFTHQIVISAFSSGLTINSQRSYQGDVEASIDQTINASATNVEILVALDVSALKSIIVLASNDCTIKTNSSGSPTDTINIEAGIPYVWTTDSYEANKFTADVSKIFVTNLAATALTFRLLALTDSP